MSTKCGLSFVASLCQIFPLFEMLGDDKGPVVLEAEARRELDAQDAPEQEHVHVSYDFLFRVKRNEFSSSLSFSLAQLGVTKQHFSYFTHI